MKVITHKLQCVNPTTRQQYELYIDVCRKCERKHGLPDHAAYLGVHHGLHKGNCLHPNH